MVKLFKFKVIQFSVEMNFILMVVIVLSKFVDTKHTSTHCQIGKNIDSLNSTMLPIQSLVSMEKGERKRYHFHINAPTTIKITFSSCTNFITSKLYYNQSIQIAKASSSLSVQCAPIGHYDLVVQARKSCSFELKTLLHHPNENWPLLKLIESSKLKYQSRIKKGELTVKWNKSKLDIHAVHYCLAINMKENQKSLCEAITHSAKPSEISRQLCVMSSLDHLYHNRYPSNTMKLGPDLDLVRLTCEGRKNHLIVRGLLPNKKYYIDLFGVHTKLENLTFLLNSSFVWFNRTRPIVLQNNSLTTFQLPKSGRPAVFVYKVPMYDTCRQIKLFIVPCGRNVRLKVISKFNQNTTAMEFHKSTTILLNSKSQDKFVFKFSNNEMFSSRSSKKIRVFLSCSDSYTQLPQLPQNLTLEQNDIDDTDCTITSISWNPSPDHRTDIWYCIYLIEINQRSQLFDDLFLPNVCVGTSPNKHPQLYQMQCIQSPIPKETENNLRIHHTLNELNPNRYYAVYVMLRSNNISLPYDKLLINTRSKCTFGLSAYETEQNSHGSKYYS